MPAESPDTNSRLWSRPYPVSIEFPWDFLAWCVRVEPSRRRISATACGAIFHWPPPCPSVSTSRFGLLNDAEIQGFGIVKGQGLEVVLTLGTGAGTAVFRDGVLMPHLELAQHPIHDNQTYNDYIGSKALRRKGAKKWSHRVRKTIKILNSLLHYDFLWGGGIEGGKRAKIMSFQVDSNGVRNRAGFTGWGCVGGAPFLLTVSARRWPRTPRPSIRNRRRRVRPKRLKEIDHDGDLQLRRHRAGFGSAAFLGAYHRQRSCADGAAGGLAGTNAALA